MEIVLAIAIGVLTACGVWLLLRPRTYQVIMGLCLLGYGVNLFIFSTGRLALDSEPVLIPGVPETLQNYTDPMPQAPGPGADRHRDRLCHDRALPGRAAGAAGLLGQ